MNLVTFVAKNPRYWTNQLTSVRGNINYCLIQLRKFVVHSSTVKFWLNCHLQQDSILARSARCVHKNF